MSSIYSPLFKIFLVVSDQKQGMEYVHTRKLSSIYESQTDTLPGRLRKSGQHIIHEFITVVCGYMLLFPHSISFHMCSSSKLISFEAYGFEHLYIAHVLALF